MAKRKKSKGIKGKLADALEPKAKKKAEPLGKIGIATEAVEGSADKVAETEVNPAAVLTPPPDPNIPPWARKIRDHRRATRR